MRKIKFRGKTKYGKWAYGYLTERENGLCIDRNYVEDERNNEDPDSDVYGCPYVIPETVGQFTGMYDSNGKEIYEGDIVSWLFFHGSLEVGKVEYKREETQFRIVNRFTTMDNRENTTTIQNKRNLTVRGNIHDNPELLKGGEQ